MIFVLHCEVSFKITIVKTAKHTNRVATETAKLNSRISTVLFQDLKFNFHFTLSRIPTFVYLLLKKIC